MKRASWLGELRTALGVTRRPRKSHRQRQRVAVRRSSFETLEERHLLAVLTVNSTLDNNVFGDDLVTLREAIVAANTNTITDLGQTGSGADTIEFDAAAFATPKVIQLTFGNLIINEAVTINGPGQNLLTIDALLASRIFDITSGGLSIAGLRLTGGRVTGDGGAIRSLTSITVNQCTIIDNSATGRGGGIFCEGSLSLTESSISGNSTTGSNANGGGLYVSGLTVTNTLFSGNNATGSGGGFFSFGDAAISDSTISDNTADRSGGGFALYVTPPNFIFSVPSSHVTIVGSTISGNSAVESGGGFSAAFVHSTNTIIIENSTQGFGGGFVAPAPRNDFGYTFNDVILIDSLVSQNTAATNGGGFWSGDRATLTNSIVSENTNGGIYSKYSATLNSSTVSGNTANGPGGGVFSPGGTRFTNGHNYVYDGTVVLNSSTVTGNNSAASGGGIYAGGDVTLNSSTVGNNHAGVSGGGIFAKATFHFNRHGYFFGVTGTARLNSSTVSENESGASGGGIHARNAQIISSTVSGNTATTGGGVFSSNDATVSDSTIAGNHALSGVGGGLWNGDDELIHGIWQDPSAITIQRSILADNMASAGSPDLSPGSGSLSVSKSLIGDKAGTSLMEAQSFDVNGNLIGSSAGSGIIDPRLNPLADNGGPTKTHALLSDSPALDAIPYYVGVPIPAHDYQLNGSLNDFLGGPTLVALGGALSGNRYEFGLNQGINLSSSSFNPAQYSLEIVFKWNTLSGGLQKLIDFHNLVSDVGLYTTNDGLHFLNTAFTGGVFVANATYHLALTRDNTTDIVRAYLNGTEVWNFVDSSDLAVFDGPNQIVRFFQDDMTSAQTQAQSGSVDRIQIYNQVLTPTQVTAIYHANVDSFPDFDQRGTPYGRVRDGDGVNGPQADMGAYEVLLNAPPVFTSANVVNVPENTTTVVTVTATDADLQAQAVTFSIAGGADQSKFGITTGGVLSFASAPNFEAPTDSNGDNIYVVTVQANDGNGGMTSQTINVTVTPVNDNSPVFTSTNTASVLENTTAVKTVTATDADLPSQAITFSITGGADQAKFGITTGGVLSFLSPPNFAAPGDANGNNVYVVTVQASDGNGGLTSQTINVTVTSVIADFGDAPDLGLGTGTGNYNTLLSDNGPRHTIVAGLRMGANVDGGDGGVLQNGAANADDVNGALPDDEDGLTNPAADLVLTVGAQPTVNVWVTNTTGAAATLYGWIDYNANGVFDNATERASVAVPNGSNNVIKSLVFPVVPAGFTGTTYARFRLSTDAASANPMGAANDGEVEDYRATITRPGGTTVDSAKTKLIAHNTGGGPTLVDADQFGHSVTALGDLDGDGVTDVAVGTIGDDTGGTGRGAVQVLFMNANGTVKSSQKIAHNTGGGPTLGDFNRFGFAVASLGDLDGDGVTDLAVGALNDSSVGTNRGAVYILFLNSNGTVKSSQKIASGIGGGPTLANGDYFGGSLAALGDLDGDGVTDMAVGALRDDTGGTNRGAVHVLFMNANGSVKSSQKIAHNTSGGPTLADGDIFGFSVASLGDLDGDGVSDVAVGAVHDDTGGADRGAVHVLFLNANGSVKSSQKIASGTGGGPGLTNVDQFGFSVASLGDLDGDGVADLAVGATYDDTGGSGRGALHVLLLNANGTAKSSQKIASGTGGGPAIANDSSFGSGVASLGDLDGDGRVDLVVGAEREDTGGLDRGAVYVLYLQGNTSPIFTSTNTATVPENSTTVKTVTATDADLPAQTVTFSLVGGADQARFGITSDGQLSFAEVPDFEAPVDSNTDNVYLVTVQASDGNGGTTTQTISVTVTPVNEKNPVFGSPAVVVVAENTSFVTPIVATDADLPSQTITYSIIGGADQSKFSFTSGNVLTFQTPPNFEAPSDSNGDNIYVVVVQASDGNGGTATQTLTIPVVGVNDNSPVFTSTNAASVPENSIAVKTVTATDADLPAQSVTYSIAGGADQAKFAITTGGALSFAAAPNFEAPTDANGDNVYVVTVQASDGNGGVATQTINVTVTAVNDNSPVFTSPNTANVPENSTPVMTVTATDADIPAQSVTFSIIAGADQTKFGITSVGVLTFNAPPVFAAPTDANGDNIYIVTIQASDGNGGLTSQTISVTVTAVPADYGDAPDTGTGAVTGNYNTQLSDNGPRHAIVTGIRMGANLDGGDGGLLQNLAANADDVNGALPDDEDGLVHPAADLILTVGAQPTVNVRVTNTTGATATLYGWIDYNANGVFDNATERASVVVPNGTNNLIKTLVFPAVPGGFNGNTYARFRLSTDTAAANSTGAAGDGEVEDYRVAITKPSDTTVDSAKSKLIASNTNGGPNLANADYFGTAVASIGDLDGDGVNDMAVGAHIDSGGSNSGAVYVMFMNANGTVKSRQKITSGIGGGPTLANLDYFGRSITSMGDLDGDGVSDLAVGADKDDTGGYGRGAVYVLFMNSNGTVKGSQKIANGTGGGPLLGNVNRFGSALAPLGDLDGDGVADLAVGAGSDNTGGYGRGAVHILLMNTNGTVKSSQKIADGVGGGPSTAISDHFGVGLASPGDLDGDGLSDLTVGVFGDDSAGANRGAIQVLFLNANGTVKSSQKIASGVGGGPILTDGAYFGSSVGTIGDLDGDGVTDLAVGARYDSAGGTNRGAVYVLLMNANGTVKGSQKIASGIGGGPTLLDGDTFGHAVTSLGDLDGDGRVDLIVGAERDDTGGTNRGAVHVLFLKPMNSNPVFTSPNSANVPENTTTVMTVTATDVDLPASITFSIIGGADQALFGITPSGALSFNAAPNFEAPTDANGDNVYSVTVQASDGNGGTTSQTINATVTPVNDNSPVFTSTDTANVPENTTAVNTVIATDADLPAQAITYSIVGGADQSKFGITSGGALSFLEAPNFEAPTDSNADNLYIVIVQASDGNFTNIQAILVTVTNSNELPGDYNFNGVVDAADYVFWRNTLGTVVPNGTAADGNGNGVVDAADRAVWMANFGKVMASASANNSTTAASIAESTEPASLVAAAGPSGATGAEPAMASMTSTDSSIEMTIGPASPPGMRSDFVALTKPLAIKSQPVADLVAENSPPRFLPVSLLVQRDRLRINGALPTRPLLAPTTAAQDDALVAWLARKPYGSRHLPPAEVWQDRPGEFEEDDGPDPISEAIDLAFASLEA